MSNPAIRTRSRRVPHGSIGAACSRSSRAMILPTGAPPVWFSSDFRLIHQAEIRGITLRRSQPTTGKSVGKPRLLPKCCHTTPSLPRGNR
jgi:hypothetical protein